MTIFGVTAPPGELVAHREVYGPLGYPRFFYAPGKPYGWRTWPVSTRAPGEVPVISAKTWDPAAFTALVAGATAPWWFAYFHEPEDDIVRGALTVEQMAGVYRRAREILDAMPFSGGRLILILNWHQLSIKGFDSTRFDPLLEYVDAVGVDTYVPAADTSRGVYTTPGDLLGPAVDIAERAGVPWSVPEFGVKLIGSDSARHARVVGRYADWIEGHGADWVSWWCSLGGDYAPHMCTDPAYSAALDVWRSRMS